MWQRVIIFLSSAPITVLINSLRIGIVGITVEHWGIEMAEGVLHDFEGWVLFMVCTAILVLEVWVFWFFSRSGRSFSESFGLVWPSKTDSSVPQSPRRLSYPLVFSVVAIVAAVASSPLLADRTYIYPDRQPFSGFPTEAGDWESDRQLQLASIVVNALNAEDTYLANFRSPAGVASINLHMTYYKDQRAGAAVHSPRACLPGDGWKVVASQVRPVPSGGEGGAQLTVNRVEMAKGDRRQLVYYWFPQRHRNLTSEYLVKWFMFYDSITLGRSDGGLVRLVTPLDSLEDWDAADARLTQFIGEISPDIRRFIPN
jgi:exosortase D (VPLPA-CTERM-specific)